ncbi:MAG TPA: NUDIX hydrolase [Bacilli bacterium]|nr:NUDIX hydrolase [Bacilli bacterium]
MKKFEEKTIKTEQIFTGRMIDLSVDTVVLPDGTESTREIVNHPGAVAIIAITDEGKIVVVEQYRKPLEKSLLEIPAGKLEPGENPVETAKRELEEETGYRANRITYLTSSYTSPGFANEILYFYLADQLTAVENGLQADDDEFVEVFEYTLEELAGFEKSQRIHDLKTSYAIQYLKLRNDKGTF